MARTPTIPQGRTEAEQGIRPLVEQPQPAEDAGKEREGKHHPPQEEDQTDHHQAGDEEMKLWVWWVW